MKIQNIALIILWGAFLAIWVFSAPLTKREAGDVSPARRLWRSLDILGNIILISFVPRQAFFMRYLPAFRNPLVLWLGFILCGSGIAVMVWARWYLGKNWGAPKVEKENPELVTDGPYRFVRHPIYSGGLLAIFGTGFVVGVWYWGFLIVFALYFMTSARSEEQTLTKLFGEKYAAYKIRTKMIIPFVF